MDIRFKCDKCNQHITAPEDMVGSFFTCPNPACRCSLTVPSGSALPSGAPAQTDDITFNCPFCRQQLIVGKKGAGVELACPKCGKMVVVPKLAASAEPQQPQSALAAPDWTLRPPPIVVAPSPQAPPPRPQPMPITPILPAMPIATTRTPGGNPLVEFILSIFSRSLNDYGKRLGLIWGIALLVGFVMPIIAPKFGGAIPYRLMFPFVEVLRDSDESVAAKLLSLYPLFAGIGMILLALLARGWIRAVGMLGIGLLVWLIALPLRELRLLTAVPDCGAGAGAFLFVTFLGMMMYVGLRVQEAVPGVLSGRLLASASGAVLLLSGLLLPLLREPFGVLMALPFHLMSRNVFEGFMMLLTLMALAAVAVVACLGFVPKLARQQQLVSLGIWILWGVMLLSPVLLTVGTWWHIQQGIGVVLVPVSIAARMELVVYGLLSATVIGLVELFGVASAAGFNLTRLLRMMEGTTPEQTKKM